MAFDAAPPFHAFSAATADLLESGHSVLCDPRWFDVTHGKLKVIDDQKERRLKLGRSFAARPPKWLPTHGTAGEGGDASAGPKQSRAQRRAAWIAAGKGGAVATPKA